MIVFWSADAAASDQVRAEYEHAIAAGKSIVPVLLDGMTLTAPLDQFQFLDVSDLFQPHSPEGLARDSRALMGLLLMRIFPDIEIVDMN